MICGSGGSKSRLAKAAGAEPSGQRRDEKLHAVVARSTFASQNAQNTSASDHFWKLRCRKSARRCGAKHISKSKCTPLLEVQTRFASDHYTTLYTPLHYSTLHYTPQHYNYNYRTTQRHSTTLHYIKLQYTTPHYTPLHYITLHYTLHTLHYTTLHYTIHSTHYSTLHYTTLRNTTTTTTELHNYTPLHTATLNYTTLHYTTLERSIDR